MSKAEVLLKKSAAFERLALYLDRKYFLQAIAQDATVQPFPPASNLGNTAPYVSGKPPVSTDSFKMPPTKIPLQGGGWENIPEQSLDRPIPIPPPSAEEVVPTMTVTPDSTATPAKNYGDPETVKLLQTFLASSLGSLDVLGPKGIDGKLGISTLNALRQWGQKNNIPTNDITQLLNIALNRSGYRR